MTRYYNGGSRKPSFITKLMISIGVAKVTKSSDPPKPVKQTVKEVPVVTAPPYGSMPKGYEHLERKAPRSKYSLGTMPKGWTDPNSFTDDRIKPSGQKNGTTIKLPIGMMIRVGIIVGMIMFGVILVSLPSNHKTIDTTNEKTYAPVVTTSPNTYSADENLPKIKVLWTDEEISKMSHMSSTESQAYQKQRFLMEQSRLESMSRSDLLAEAKKWSDPSTYPFTCDGCKDNKAQLDATSCPDLVTMFKENVGWAARSYIASRIVGGNCLG